MRKLYIVTLFILLSVSVLSAGVLGIDREEATLVGVYIKDLTSGKVVYENNSALAMTPASITKSITTATVVQCNGVDKRFETQVALVGSVNGAVLDGNIEISAVGDPTIESRVFKSRPAMVDSIVAKITALGIKTVTGKIVINSNMPDEGVNPYWEVDDVGYSYGAGLWSMNYCDNTYYVRASDKSTMPEIPNVNITVLTGSEDVVKGINSDNVIVRCPQASQNVYSTAVAMNHPSEVVANELRKRLLKSGVQVTGGNVPNQCDRRVLYVCQSATYGDIMKSLMVRSDNLFAEAMLRTVKPGDTRANAIDAEMKYWKSQGINTDCVKLRDGSGLSRSNKFPPAFLGELLAKMAQGTNCDAYVKLFPIVGQTGTVKNFMRDTKLQGKMVMKSGSMSGVLCYAGYKLDDAGKPTHAVVVMVNNYFCQQSVLKKAIEKLLLSKLSE